jgi:outer membrane protein assembly factor BamB
MYMHDTARTGNGLDTTFSAANAAQLANVWTFPTGGAIAGGAAIVGNIAYIGSWDGYLYAIDVTTGAQQWRTFLGKTSVTACYGTNNMGISSTPAVVNGVVYVGGGDSNWYAVDAATGNTLWSVPTGDNSASGGHYNWSSPLFYNGFAYIGIASNCDIPLVQGGLLRVNLSTHQIVNTFHNVPDGQVGGAIWTSPSIDPATNTVFATTGTEGQQPITSQPLADAIVAYDATTLTVKNSWQIPINQAVADSDWGVTPLLFTDASNRQLVGSINKDGYLYVLDRNNLSAGPVWEKSIAVGGPTPQYGDGSVSNMVFDGTRLYVAGGNTTIAGQAVTGSVRAVDPSNGTFLWEQGTGLVLPALAYANGIVVDGGGSNIEVRSAATGALLYSYATASQLFGPPAIGGGRIIEGSTDHNIYAFGVGPLAWYQMESPTWNGTPGEVGDSSGNSHSGVSVGGVTTANATPALAGNPGSCRYAAGFNGSTGYLSLGSPQLSLGSGLTVMAWVRWGIVPGTGNNWANIVSNNASTAGDTGQFWLQHSQTNSAFEFAVQTTVNRNSVKSSVAPVQGVWQHVAGVYDGSTLTIYVNGTPSGTASLTGGIVAPSSAYQLDIGRWAFSSETFRSFAGDVDEVEVYNKALRASDVAAAMNATHPCAGGGTPTPTNTPVAATNTPTPTATSTPTNTPVPNQPPTVGLSGITNPVAGAPPLFVSLSAQFGDPDIDPGYYAITWGDGTVGTTGKVLSPYALVNASHTYAWTGTYTLRVGASDLKHPSVAQTFTVNVGTPVFSSGDGLPDDYKAAHACLHVGVNEATADPDGDGLTNLQEYQQGTNPCVADTDGDGYTDGQEAALAHGGNGSAYCGIMRADVDSNGVISILDLAKVAAYFTQTVPPAPARYDQDGDGKISILDLTKMAQFFGDSVSTCP